jgi:hypothetical protein
LYNYSFLFLNRNCGQVFCYKCADQFYQLPTISLVFPVRICRMCKINLERQKKLNSASINNDITGQSPYFSIFSSTPPNSEIDSIIHKQINNSTNSTNNNNANSKPMLMNKNSPCSTSPIDRHNLHQFNGNQDPALIVKSINQANLINCNLNLNNRCKQIETEKYKKQEGKSQKISV